MTLLVLYLFLKYKFHFVWDRSFGRKLKQNSILILAVKWKCYLRFVWVWSSNSMFSSSERKHNINTVHLVESRLYCSLLNLPGLWFIWAPLFLHPCIPARQWFIWVWNSSRSAESEYRVYQRYRNDFAKNA